VSERENPGEREKQTGHKREERVFQFLPFLIIFFDMELPHFFIIIETAT